MTAAWIASHLRSLLFRRVETMSEVTLTDAQSKKVRQTVFKSFDKCVYRIPALFYETETETLLAFAEQRKAAADSSAKMLVMRSGKLKEEAPGVKSVEVNNHCLFHSRLTCKYTWSSNCIRTAVVLTTSLCL